MKWGIVSKVIPTACLIKHYPCDKAYVYHTRNIHHMYEIKILHSDIYIFRSLYIQADLARDTERLLNVCSVAVKVKIIFLNHFTESAYRVITVKIIWKGSRANLFFSVGRGRGCQSSGPFLMMIGFRIFLLYVGGGF